VLTSVEDIYAVATVQSPYSGLSGSWSFGIIFRSDTGFGAVVFTETGSWKLIHRPDTSPESSETLQSGTVTNLNILEGGVNEIGLMAKDNVGALYLNGQRVVFLDITNIKGAGTTSLVTAYYSGQEAVGTVAEFTGFEVWSLGN
jgi:hypothetical protein